MRSAATPSPGLGRGARVCTASDTARKCRHTHTIEQRKACGCPERLAQPVRSTGAGPRTRGVNQRPGRHWRVARSACWVLPALRYSLDVPVRAARRHTIITCCTCLKDSHVHPCVQACMHACPTSCQQALCRSHARSNPRGWIMIPLALFVARLHDAQGRVISQAWPGAIWALAQPCNEVVLG